MTEQQEIMERVGEQLRTKITSKFQASSFLAGLAVTLLGVQLSNAGAGKPPLFSVAVGLLFAAVILYVKALVKLDELTMPKRFWDTGNGQANDWTFVLVVDDDLKELRKRMIFFWVTLTLTATSLTAFALLLLLVPEDWAWWKVKSWHPLAAALVAAVLTKVYFAVLSNITCEFAPSTSPGAISNSGTQSNERGPLKKRVREWRKEWKFVPLLRLQD